MGVSSIKIILLLYFNLYLLRTVVLRKLFDRDSQYHHYSKSFEYTLLCMQVISSTYIKVNGKE